MSFVEAINQRIAEERAEGHSVREIAQRFGVRVTRLRAWLRGDFVPEQRLHDQLARFLRVRREQFAEMLPPTARTGRTGGPRA